MALLDAVRAGQVDVVVAEALDRISRDQEHIAGFFKAANHAGVRIVTLAEGEISELKQRLLAPELVEQFVKTYVQEVNAANQERGARRAKLHSEQARIARQIKTVLDTIKDIGGSRSLVDDLRSLERRQDEIAADLTRESEPEKLIELHPNLPELYRRRVEALEAALQEPEGAAAAAQALRSLIDAVMFYPEEGRGQSF